MDTGGFSFALERDVKKFNGYLFKNRMVFPLPREEIGELYEAAKADWKQVEPAIFGTLLEQALNPAERRKLGAHYTPRAYVERLVIATVLEPLKAEWANVQATAETKRSGGDVKGAAALIQGFHERLCETTILDPACGTGNFLYVSLELMKRLEGIEDHRPASIFGAGGESTRGGDCRAGLVDWFFAMAFSHARRRSTRADSEGF
jgi:type I restriction-modification system DNA methylase subunit